MPWLNIDAVLTKDIILTRSKSIHTITQSPETNKSFKPHLRQVRITHSLATMSSNPAAKVAVIGAGRVGATIAFSLLGK